MKITVEAVQPDPARFAELQQEVETLREGIKEIAEREQSIRDNWVRFEAETGARILELETDLEVANDKVERLRDLLDRTIPDTMEYDAESGGFYDTELTHDIRAALGGQSIE